MSFNISLALLKILNDPYQRFGWDDDLIDMREVELIESDDFIHHICYAAWKVPKNCRYDTGLEIRDACYSLTTWRNLLPGSSVMTTENK